MAPPLSLADSFPTATAADWNDAVRRARRLPADRDAPPGGDLMPLFRRRADARAIIGRAPGALWAIVQRVDAASADAAITALAEDIAGGATGAEIAFAGALHPLGGRLALTAASAVADALSAKVRNFALRVSCSDRDAVAAFFAAAAAAPFNLVIAHDPIAATALGRSDPPDEVGALADLFEAGGVDGAVVIADGRVWHAGGATDEQELGATLATYVAHLRTVGVPRRIGITLVADSDQFRTIAKFRAMRLLLARVAEVAALPEPLPRIHAETAWRSMSTRSPETNVLRATSAAFGAAVGGADSITVLPFDAIGGGDAHGRRLARNTHLVLAEEGGLARIADPGAGSGAIEAMTATLAEAAWRRFQEIELEGGIRIAIAAGGLLREIAAARSSRLAGVAAGETKMVGVNAYRERAESASTARRRPPDREAELAFVRLAEPFE